MALNRRNLFSITAATAVLGAPAAAADTVSASLPGFRSGYANVNGIRMHYVTGGRGRPVVLVPGWPQTWWEFHKIMPALAAKYRVIAVDLRGQGGSDKPAGGYDKKTMARDIYELVRRLGYSTVDIIGHDIGAMVAFSFAANHPDATRTVSLLDVSHPDENLFKIPLLAPPGTPVHVWWFAFNQVRGLPEQLLTGRFRYMVDWLFDTILVDKTSISDRDRAIYAAAWNRPDAIRAGNAWYQGFYQDIEDQKGYPKITAPMLGLAAEYNDTLQYSLPDKGTDVKLGKIAKAGHFLPEEQPEAVLKALAEFL
ncbi:alpha/beta hydrolase [Kibdelosporangium aridum]|uniref:Alpha/beta hydrolase n=1 Tax=Kibdelosporangium aridum TaxID=2030 RepID=A0A428ZUT1_KIBAR|nr:alpha/beta hydrolase [Kibdelosporangium aridum]RSM91785.1 alpha/beta hydrolase [Kibdelosporangium aridum]